jgi:hypothetical protein
MSSGSARTDFATIESELEVIQKQLARLPTRRELGRTAFGIIFANADDAAVAVLSALVGSEDLDASCLRSRESRYSHQISQPVFGWLVSKNHLRASYGVTLDGQRSLDAAYRVLSL